MSIDDGCLLGIELCVKLGAEDGVFEEIWEDWSERADVWTIGDCVEGGMFIIDDGSVLSTELGLELGTLEFSEEGCPEELSNSILEGWLEGILFNVDDW